MHNFNLRKSQNGVTLIELLIALALGVIVIIGVSQGLLSMTNSSRLQTNNSTLQENGDSALSYVAFKMRNALSTPCDRYSRYMNKDGLYFDNKNIADYEPNDSSFNEDLRKMVGGLGVKVENTSGTLGNTDKITFIGTGQRLFTSADTDYASTRVDVKGVFAYSGTESDAVYVITDCKNMDIFQATPPTATPTTGTTTLTLNSNIKRKYDAGAMVAPLDVAEIYVNNNKLYSKNFFTSRPGGPLLDNVELIRMIFSVDEDGDGRADRYITAKQVDALNGTNTHILSADVYLMVRLANTEVAMPDSYDLFMPNSSSDITGNFMEKFTFTDKIPRKVFSRSIAFRNNTITLDR